LRRKKYSHSVELTGHFTDTSDWVKATTGPCRGVVTLKSTHQVKISNHCLIILIHFWAHWDPSNMRYNFSVGTDFGQIFNWLLFINNCWDMSNKHTVNKFEHKLNYEPLLSPFGHVKQEIQHFSRHRYQQNL
jgi:hypothetical protein